jgi:predicted double-glycine peptidase
MQTAALLLAGLLLLASEPCSALDLATPGGLRLAVPVASIKAMRFGSTLRQQYDFSCGSAAVATLLSHHYGRATTEQQVFEHMFRHGDHARIRREGFSLLDMQRFLAAQGLRADGFKLPLQALLDAGLPAIVLVAEQGYQHFVVIKGIAASERGATAERGTAGEGIAAGGRLLLGDPARGTRSMPLAQFESIWTNKLLFVIHDHAGPVRFNAPDDWRAAPPAPLASAVNRLPLGDVTMAKHGPGDF